MTDMTAETRTEARPYEPSWVDRLNDWVRQLPAPEWVFYAALGLGLMLIQMLFLWLDGGLQFDALLPVIIFNGLAIPYELALIQLLDNQAVTALDTMRPALTITEPQIDRFRYRLSTMPSRATYIAGLTLVVFLILTERLGSVPIRYEALEHLLIFSVVFQVIDKGTAFVAGALIYHTIVQLRLVNTIYSDHTRINLYDLRPLYAFSRLTASTAAALVLMTYGWMWLNPELLKDAVGLAGTASFTALAVGVFVWPLVGAHRLMEAEKGSLLGEIDRQFEAVFAQFNQRLRDGDHSATDALNGTIVSLEIQQRKIEAIPTWPWRPETVRSVLTAIGLPLAVRVLQLIVEQALNW
jgi:hypothetical protein